MRRTRSDSIHLKLNRHGAFVHPAALDHIRLWPGLILDTTLGSQCNPPSTDPVRIL